MTAVGTASAQRRRVGVFSSSRGDARAAAAIVHALVNRDDVEPVLFVSGVHVVEGFGETLVVQDNVDVWRIECDVGSDDGPDVLAHVTSDITNGLSAAFSSRPPDILVVIGDRYELLPVASDDSDASPSANGTRERWRGD